MESLPVYEVEAKFRVEVPEELRRLLPGSGVRVRQSDTFYTHPDHDMAARDEALRLRREEGARGQVLELTWKGPRQDGSAKVRREENVRLLDDPSGLLLALGYRPVHAVVKERTTYDLDGVHVTLDKVEGLGWFAEVEALGPDAEVARLAVEAVVDRFGLSGHINESYLELLLRS